MLETVTHLRGAIVHLFSLWRFNWPCVNLSLFSGFNTLRPTRIRFLTTFSPPFNNFCRRLWLQLDRYYDLLLIRQIIIIINIKIVDNFTYIGCSSSSSENDINMWLAKVWTAIDRLSVIWKSNLSDKIKHSFFPKSSRVHTTLRVHHLDAD